MSLKPNYHGSHLKAPLTPNRNLAIFRGIAFQVRECRGPRRRILKSNRNRFVRSQLGPSPFENLFQNLVSQFPSVNSLDLIAPALGFTSGVALYLSRFKPNRNYQVTDIGEWILFTSPTPFNRFVMLRCPTISFEGSELLEDVNERLVKEERHFVRLNSGRIQERGGDERDEAREENIVYQRECVSTEDGGVISLDWPANLDFTEERGLDTTLLIIPGTAEGSMDKNIRSFVCESLMRGYFPVVVNPRGCAGSPLTTARLFTAADSDDICTAIQFISRARPWTTLMGVGWGYGANMLTKYLAEVGERTPLTAATCIDNPFDLEEATRSSLNHIALNQKQTDGLRNILQSNKELFRGRAKGFDVEKALRAKSVRDFDKAISMVSYGFDVIEDFYAKSSTVGVIGNVKIPVLFIQIDDGMVPLYSIPRSLIAENPFTSLLLCSCLPSKVIKSGRYATYWCQHLTIEWLAAVELGLLKGRHPLLEDVDVTLNPAKGLTRVEGRASAKSGRVNKSPNHSQSYVLNGCVVHPLEEKFGESNTSVIVSSQFRRVPQKKIEIGDKGLEQKSNGPLDQTSSLNTELDKEEISTIDNERGQVLQTAQVVMNMLDVTMPNTLTEEQKKKVLTAVDQGETVMKALQDAVPEDVRGKFTAAVSEIFHNQGTNFKLNGLLNIGSLPTMASESKSKTQENAGGRGYVDPHSSDPRNSVDDLVDNSNDNQVSMDKPAAGVESEHKASSDALQKTIDCDHFQSTIDEGEISSSEKEDTTEWKISHKNADMSRERASESSDNAERAGGTEDAPVDPQKVDQNGVSYSSSDQDKTTSSTKAEDGLLEPVASSVAQPMEGEGIDNLKREETSLHSVSNENNSDSLTFSVSQAFDALTGMDDSTQVAVNSVFGVIEDMITQLEVEKENETDADADDSKEVEDRRTDSLSQNHQVTNDYSSTWREENKNDLSLQSDMVDDLSSNDGMDLRNSARARWAEEERPRRSSDPFKGNNITSSWENDKVSRVHDEDRTREHLVNIELLAEHSNKVRHLYNVPLYITASPYSDSIYKEYLLKYLVTKMPNTKSLDLDTTTALFLDYFPEEHQWKLLELPGNNDDSAGGYDEFSNKDIQAHLPSKACIDEVIEPQYVIVDAGEEQEPIQEFDKVDDTNQKVVMSNETSEDLMAFVKTIILDSLNVEVGRRLSMVNTKEIDPNLTGELEEVATAVSLAAGHLNYHISFLDSEDCNSEKLGTLNGEHIVKAILFSVQETNYLRRVLPVGVVVGSILAALRRYFNVATINGSGKSEAMTLDQINHYAERNGFRLFETEADPIFPHKIDRKYNVSGSRDGKEAKLRNLKNGRVMVGAVTAALGASALLVHQQDSEQGNETSKSLFKSSEEKGNHQKEPDKLEEDISEKSENNIVTSLAEKAMSVAGPVVPTKEDGEVDHERLLAMLTELGQKGGILKLVGKVALLWGGLRGAISLTDRLILFLRLAERPLLQRILGFVCMVLVLWSPVVVPLLPTLVRSWATHNSSKFAELACIVGLYASIIILVMLWGKRIRGYENPFEQYGMDFTSLSKIQIFLKGLVGGFILVLSIHSLNALIGSVRLSWPSTFVSYSSDAVTWLKVFAKMLLLVGQGIIIATGIALVEELLFRSWLPDEIATDLGYYRAVIISGLAFSLLQRSPSAIPGLWLLSLGLSGARHRSQGSLSIPIGLRSGIMASSFVLEKGGFLTYLHNFPVLIARTRPFQPFSGIAGLAFALLLAIVLYPRHPIHQQRTTREIQD
ncbi:uncharacterized protein LOC130790052 isoform X1 [Actinidia eriantha]|uniref:uncharacterized protein LOC130790052 isoform X1 n=2 Tax=Actinidia eriantha TaxID=165200 RepID=UPI0025855932|nr:uncharacterized protein LOC130790052 isoform X1 [Actinidia eriantha]